jgi:peptidoglycan/xylan/chitin deacetylase (PgdA/CDA1 family)
VSILCYHTVHPEWRSPLAVTPASFERHCAWLSTNRRVVELPEALEHLDAAMRLPGGEVLLTFDDGFASLYDYALPILRKHALPATVFLVAETLTPNGRPVDWTPVPPHAAFTLTREQVLEMQAEGIRFGSHSYSHFDLSSMTHSQCVTDLRRSREALEDLLQEAVTCLAYPRGRHDASVRSAAEEAGYSCAFSLPERAEHVGRYAIPRVGVYPANKNLALRLKSMPLYAPLRMSPVFPALRLLARGNRHSVRDPVS